MNTSETRTPTRQAAIHGLAVVGFITLVALGLSLAVYSERYVPNVVSYLKTEVSKTTSYLTTAVPNVISRIGSAAVTLSHIFTPAPKPSLAVIPTASTTISFGNATSTRATPTPTTTPKKPVPAIPKSVGEKTSGAYPISGNPGTQLLSGLSDFIVSIKAVGYLATTSAESFVASSTVPSGSRPAVTFTIKNIGTNATGVWRFSASIPTQSAFIYQSQPQQSLNPGDSIDYTLGFDQAITGTDKMISITANFDRTVTELSTDNNSASAKITILGS